ncbi:hypothetical protein AYI68_g3273 [Smittium mucronatum]|uniref:Uncharacterized protein n=1 Tax=Smittium mucronatum TaxID=133383 RepID=A0A1R0H0D6_9FUNG|nr:hypothetical protein AYI68_g3273 [Smittium mucronatum]
MFLVESEDFPLPGSGMTVFACSTRGCYMKNALRSRNHSADFHMRVNSFMFIRSLRISIPPQILGYRIVSSTDCSKPTSCTPLRVVPWPWGPGTNCSILTHSCSDGKQTCLSCGFH